MQDPTINQLESMLTPDTKPTPSERRARDYRASAKQDHAERHGHY
jgi:hypothetical protein